MSLASFLTEINLHASCIVPARLTVAVITYSVVKCTPPCRPLVNFPFPLPPARICALRTNSFASNEDKNKQCLRA